MSESDEIEVLVEREKQNGDVNAQVLGRGESMAFGPAQNTQVRIEVRPAEEQEP